VACQVHDGENTYSCAARDRLLESDTAQSNPLAVGDRVKFQVLDTGEGVVEEVLPRESKLSRAHPHDERREKVIVANVDQLLIVTSVRQPPLNISIIDRYLIAAARGGVTPVLCINKIDLAETEDEYERVAQIYRDEGLDVVTTSAKTGAGTDALKGLLADCTTVFAGHSGVGKSSLLNCLQPGLELRTGQLSHGGKGRHVTSAASLLDLDFGAYVVDTPGIREFTLWDLEKAEVPRYFPGILKLSGDCKMPDCSHTHEPDCAVKRAVENGDYPKERYDSYCRILESVERPEVPRKTDVERPDEQIPQEKREKKRQRRRDSVEEMIEEELERWYRS
jgi:ribosome biogenesis GTPase